MRQLRSVAIVGLSCRFPSADDPLAFWRVLRDGRDVVREIPRSRWDVDRIYNPDVAHPGTITTRYGSFLDQVDGIDWRTLRISPREARFMDPQQRLLLELAWEALEDAGIPFEQAAGSRTGVYVGIKWNDYAKLQALRPEGIDGFTVNGSDLSLAANRISYQFDLVGPSVALDVGCASSLVAVHLAASGIRSGETDVAIAGGVNLMLALDSFLCAAKANLLAPDGRCKMFDAAADGYVRAEGGGLVVLKSLDRALADGDRIWGVVRGSAVMHNGHTEWIMASSPQAQERLMREALAQGGVDPAEVGYVELHGTGTRKGDPIEARAVGAVYGGPARERPVLVGSVKTNLGHAEAAAGIAGLAKVLLSLGAGEVPPNLHFNTPNPEIPLDQLGIEVVTRRTPWAAPRLAAINSLSFGGGNAHLVIEGPPEEQRAAAVSRTDRSPVVSEERPCLLVLSARSEAALRDQAGRMGRWLKAEQPALRDVAWTAAVRRTHHERRLAVSGSSLDEVARRLGAFAGGAADPVPGAALGTAARAVRPVLVFSGQGTTWPGMVRSLMAAEPVVQDALARWDRLLSAHVDWSLLEELAREDDEWRLDRTALAQPAIVAIQVAMAELWRAWGVEPAAVVGHSVGEIAAAHVAGVLGAEEAARIACERGRLMQSVEGRGRMLHVASPPEELAPRIERLGGRVEVGTHNGPAHTVLSGDRDAVEALAGELAAAGLTVRMLPVDYAFHSRHLDDLIAPLVERLGSVQAAAPSIPLYSTLTGRAWAAGDFEAAYWGRQMREPVQFFRAVDTLVAGGHDTFIEVGPAAVLGESVRAILAARGAAGGGEVVGSGRRRRDELPVMTAAAAALHVRGVRLDLEKVLGGRGRLVSLPGYAWQRDRLWFDSAGHGAAGASRGAAHGEAEEIAARADAPVGGHPLLGRHTELAAPAGVHVWDCVLDPGASPWMLEHAVGGVPVLPASAYLEAVSAAVEQALGWGACRLVDVEFTRALSVRAPTPAQLVLSPLGDGRYGFELFAREVGGATAGGAAGPWLRRAGGRVEALALSGEGDAGLDLSVAASGPPMEQAACYAELARSGDGFGPAFQGIEAAWRRAGDVVTRVAAPASIARELGRFGFHPALLDACMHSLPLIAAARGDRGCMPTRIEEVRIAARGQVPCWSRVTRRGPDAAGTSAPDRADIEVFDAEGRALLVARDLHLRWLDGSVQDAGSAGAAHPWCYRIEHRRLEPRRGEAAGAAHAGPWRVLGDRGGLGRALVAALAARGQTASLVELGAHDGAAAAVAALEPGVRIADVRAVDAPGLDAADPTDLDAGLMEACGGVVDVAGALSRRSAPAGLWLVTRGARRLGLRDREAEPVSPVQAALWGLGRTIAQELPGNWGGLVDVDPAASVAQAAAELAGILCQPVQGEDVVIRGGALYAPRLVRQPLIASEEGFAVRPDAAYLVTGGSGGLGHLAARRLAERGARTLILMGRTALPPRDRWDALEPGSRAAEQVAKVRELEALGAAVHAAAVDVAERGALAAWLEAYRAAGHPPIRGVVHCAGRVEFEPLAHVSPASLRGVLAAKALGAVWLDQLLDGDELELFAIYSSAASVLDSPMLGHYAAANAFVDGLAEERVRRGRPAVAINWGPWSEVGMVTRADDHGPDAGHGQELIAPAVGMDLFERILAAGAPQVAVLPIEWEAWRAAHPGAAAAPLLSELMPAARDAGGAGRGEDKSAARPVPGAAAGGTAAGVSWAEQVAALPDGEQVPAVLEVVRTEVARALFLDGPDAVEPDQPLRDLGFDSLMATELSSALGKRLGSALPAMLAFDHPTPRALSAHLVTRLPPAATATRSAEVPAAPVSAPAAPVSAPAAPVSAPAARLGPLSPGQQRLHFLDRLAPPSSQYVEFFAIEVTGGLDVALLRRCLALMVGRHETLRTTFPSIALYPDPAELPRALVAPDGPVPIELIDLAGEADPDARAGQVAAEVLGAPFDLARGPLWRGLVLTLAPDRHLLWFAQHHIITDAISIGVFAEELSRLYAGGGDAGLLPPLERHYGDFAGAERERAQGDAYQAGLSWWRDALAGLEPLQLPRSATTDPVPDPGDPGAGVVSLSLPAPLVARIKETARREGATPFELLLAVWAQVLSRYTGQTDVPVGTMVAQDRSAAGGALGFFVNTLVLRCDLSGSPSVRELVRRVGEATREALAHRAVDFGDVVRALRQEGGGAAGSAGPVQATLNLVPAFPPLAGGAHSGWAWAARSWVPVHRPAKFELSLELVDGADGMEGRLEYATALFDRDAARAMARHFQVLLEAALAAPGRSADTLPLLTPAETHRLLVEWNDTAAPQPDACLHQLFAEQVARCPDAVAVEFEGRRLTYRQLDERANQLAHHLRAQGAGPDARVAVCVSRSANMVVALLGILKSGAAYVALDPANPRERLAFMLDDSRPAALVTDSAACDHLPPHAAPRVCLDRDADRIAAGPTTAPDLAADPDRTAYIIYTSGSTGRPKAVQGLHRGAVNFLRWLWKELPFEPGDVCAQKTALSFVDAYVEIFAPLCQGVPLVVVPERASRDPEALVEVLARAGVTRLVLVPSLLAAMLELDPAVWGRLGRLRDWLLSGEKLPDDLCDRLWQRRPGAVVLNTYGSSEVSANVTFHRCQPGTPVSIGRPLDNTRVYVLDQQRQLVPVGVPGELYIGGVGLARGYLFQPELTDERFVPDPFSEVVGERLYRTGDRVRWLRDGTLEYLGRVDHQVKIRGHRVELGEVEAALGSHPDLAAAAAVVREDAPGDARLLAYVVPRTEPGPTAAALRDHLARTLPEAMIPSGFAVLASLPLTPSGKIDRRGLAAIEAPRAQAADAAARVAPAGDVEQGLAQIWREVLGVADIDARRTFFEQGGNSLLLVRVQQRIRATLGVELSVADLFGYPTIRALAERLARPAIDPVRAAAAPAHAAPELAIREPAHPTRPAAAMSVDELERLIDQKYLERRDDGTGGR